MKIIIVTIILLLSLFIISCSKNNNPISNEENTPLVKDPVGTCSFSGIEIEFVDSCSYNFIITFLSNLDSIVIQNTHLGSTFYLYADSGDYNYWLNYFKNDSTIQNMYGYNSSDSLVLVIELTGQKSLNAEKQRFSEIKNLRIIKIEEYSKLVYIDVPENTETKWKSSLDQYIFISHVYLIYVCTDS